MYSLDCPPCLHSSKEHIRKKRTVVPSCTENEELSQFLKLYESNKIQTTKYSLFSFLPKNLFEQLHRFANIYFIFLAALNFVPVVEAFQPEIALAPITLVLSVTAVKNIWEDFRRFKLDHSINRLLCHIYSRVLEANKGRQIAANHLSEEQMMRCSLPWSLLVAAE
ncbi:probable phospholipid-transporting ATPase VA [Cyclopterus lumpus]|uniref:probable phospholipid-transporting ATPase VA n=1 Tax=Cyclopterus lumpus TaxID=8103 RepID=UPI001486E1B1|nr:probable phospholipid-transporting ATPase VA [Cyclopterus lumpus]